MLGRDRIGIVVNEENAWASAQELNELGPLFLRSIVFDMNRFGGRVDALPPEVRIIALLNSETFLDTGERVGLETSPGWEERWSRAIDLFVARFRNSGRRIFVECLNEWDLLNLPPEVAVKAVALAAPKLRPANIGCLLGSVASSDWPAQLGRAIQLLSGDVRALLDGVCFHPYLKSVIADGSFIPPEWRTMGTVSEAVQQAHGFANPDSSLKNLPVFVTEFGLNRLNVVGDSAFQVRLQSVYVKQAYEDFGRLTEQQLGAACWFSWNDRTGVLVGEGPQQRREQFGLWPEDDTLPAWATRAAFIECTFPPVAPLAAQASAVSGASAAVAAAVDEAVLVDAQAASSEQADAPAEPDGEQADAAAELDAEQTDAPPEPDAEQTDAAAEPDAEQTDASAEPAAQEALAVAESEPTAV